MDIERVLKTRVNRKSRVGRPYEVFYSSFEQCLEGARQLILEPDSRHANLLKRAMIITMVSSIEVYYKDVLDGIFRICHPLFFEPHLKNLHTTKYDIVELVAFYKNEVHPLELVAINQSFQNVEAIDRVFSRFLGKSLWGTIMEMDVRVTAPNIPVAEASFEPSLLTELKQLFALRHELVHDSSQTVPFSQSSLDMIVAASFLLFGSDIVLMKMITDNADPAVKIDAEPGH